MSGVTGYPRTRGKNVPLEVVDALVVTGHITPEEATEYALSTHLEGLSGADTLRSIVQSFLKDRKDDVVYLDKINAQIIARQHDGDPPGDTPSVVAYHYSGARELPGFQHEEIDYQKKVDRAQYAAERDAFDRSERSNWVKDVAVRHRDELLAAGLPFSQIDRMARTGRVPDGYQVHHRIPLDDGGKNLPENYILLRNDVEHRALHGYYNPAELRIRLLAPGEQAKVALPIPPCDTVIYPNPAKGYESRHVSHSKFLEMLNVD